MPRASFKDMKNMPIAQTGKKNRKKFKKNLSVKKKLLPLQSRLKKAPF